MTTTIHFSGLYIPPRRETLVPSSFVLRLPGLHVDFTTELVANLYSGGTFTHWVTTSNFIPIYVDSQGFGLTLARVFAWLGVLRAFIQFSISSFVHS